MYNKGFCEKKQNEVKTLVKGAINLKMMKKLFSTVNEVIVCWGEGR